MFPGARARNRPLRPRAFASKSSRIDPAAEPRSVRWARSGGRRQVQPFERSEALIDFPEGDLDGAQPVVILGFRP